MARCERQDGRWLRTLTLGFVALLASCHSLHFTDPGADKASKDQQVPTAPTKYQLRVSQYVFCSDFELKRDQPIFLELAGLRDQVYARLQLPGSNTVVTVYLFEDRERYERFMRARYPDLPKRRAFFVAQPRGAGGAEDLLVYTYWGDRVQQDLRHELTHALLHSVLKDVPLWLDEGIAEYFELPPDRHGINSAHLDQLCRGASGPARPDLARLEQLSQVQQMAPAEYRESWAWVHLMLDSQPEAKSVLVSYLQQLRTTATPGPLRPRLAAIYPVPEDALAKHLAQVDLLPRPSIASPR